MQQIATREYPQRYFRGAICCRRRLAADRKFDRKGEQGPKNSIISALQIFCPLEIILPLYKKGKTKIYHSSIFGEGRIMFLAYEGAMVMLGVGAVLWRTVDIFFWIYTIMLFIRILSSWIPELQGTKFLQFISVYTDPYLNFFRKFIPPIGMIDISPIIAFLCLGVIDHSLKWIISLLFA